LFGNIKSGRSALSLTAALRHEPPLPANGRAKRPAK
jgi:hypothetical protein